VALDSEDVKAIAHLARLRIDESDIPAYVRDLSNILDFVAQMNAVDTAAVVPMAHPQAVSQRLRVDDVTEVDEHERFQAVAPQTEAALYLVPKVIE
jgi:aspartyl-tRNA(Asn)/glutamyl-tRNA(Gln) amidotransferase subunit C